MTTIYRQGPQQPWRNHVLRHGTLSRITALAEYVPPVYDGVTQRTHFSARPQSRHGTQSGAPVLSARRRGMDGPVLPQRHNASPIPQGANGVRGDEPSYYGDDGYYGDIWYSE